MVCLERIVNCLVEMCTFIIFSSHSLSRVKCIVVILFKKSVSFKI